MENTPENKAKFFALYIEQEVIIPTIPKEHWYNFDHNEGGLRLIGIYNNKPIVRRIAEDVKDTQDQCVLHLAPLSQITDEDALQLDNVWMGDNFWRQGEGFIIDRTKRQLDIYIKGNILQCLGVAPFLFLVSKGYYVGDGTEIEYGWVKLKEDSR